MSDELTYNKQNEIHGKMINTVEISAFDGNTMSILMGYLPDTIPNGRLWAILLELTRLVEQ